MADLREEEIRVASVEEVVVTKIRREEEVWVAPWGGGKDPPPWTEVRSTVPRSRRPWYNGGALSKGCPPLTPLDSRLLESEFTGESEEKYVQAFVEPSYTAAIFTAPGRTAEEVPREAW